MVLGVGRKTLPIGVGRKTLPIGVDEVARGAVWGRVYVAAVGEVPDTPPVIIRDSKRMTRKQRRESADWIRDNCVWSVSWHEAEDIDILGIDQAIWQCMDLAISNVVKLLPEAPVYVDGNRFGGKHQVTTIVGGDAKYPCIAAASILAKDTHDAWVAEHTSKNDLDVYGVASNMGYGSTSHMQAIKDWGLDRDHRLSFLGRLLNQG